MQHHYSTVNATEQRTGIARVVHLFEPRKGQEQVHGAVPGGEIGGEKNPASGEKTEKAS
jgi:hypothetical protein